MSLNEHKCVYFTISPAPFGLSVEADRCMLPQLLRRRSWPVQLSAAESSSAQQTVLLHMPDNTTELLTEQSTVAEKQLSYYNFFGVKRKETFDGRKK